MESMADRQDGALVWELGLLDNSEMLEETSSVALAAVVLVLGIDPRGSRCILTHSSPPSTRTLHLFGVVSRDKLVHVPTETGGRPCLIEKVVWASSVGRVCVDLIAPTSSRAGDARSPSR